MIPYGFKREERQAIKDWTEEEEKHIKIKPNIEPDELIEVIKGEPIFSVCVTPIKFKKYDRGEWTYLIDENGLLLAYYMPSMDKELKIMYKSKPQKREWKLLTYYEGNF